MTAKVSNAKLYDVLLGPVVTEKSTMGSEHNQVTFRVPLTASKPQIREAVEGIFGVKVKAVNTTRVRGKVKQFRGRTGKRPDYKKAMITLVDGESIDITTGI